MPEEIDNKGFTNNKKFFKNIIIVLISNIISLVSGVFIGFIVPKIMGVTEYGYYKTFTLYSSYIGILHFGFIDGIYLKFAGKSYKELDKNKFRCYSRFLFLIEAILSIFVIALSLFFLNSNLFIILFFLGLNIFASNVVTYFEFISQITMQFKRITVRNVFRCILNILSVSILYILYKTNEFVVYNYIYVAVVLSINYLLALWYFFSYKELIYGKANSFKEEKSELFSFFKVGVPLLLSNLVVLLIFVVDQQFVNIFFDVDTYSLYAFAYNMMSLITTITSAISVVLYPTLKTIDSNSIKNNYSRLNSYLLILVAFCLSAFFLFEITVYYFLPKYTGSLQTLLIILPGVLISSSISVIKYNCYKTFKLIFNYFIKSLVILALAIIADLLVYFIFKDTKSISIVSIFILVAWYLLTEMYFIRTFKIKWIKNFVYILLIMCAFYGVTFIPNVFVGFAIYVLSYVLITISLFFKEISDLLSKIKKKKDEC